jgi:hypothetical protein
MPPTQPLDYLPLWALSIVTIVVVLLATEAGYRLGRRRSHRAEPERESPVGAAVAASLGLAGFMLAFTFGIAGARFDARRQAVLAEANAIGTTYLRAGMLPDGRGEPIRELLRQYVDARLDAVRTGHLPSGLQHSAELHRLLWAQAESAARKYPTSIVVGLFVQSLNETIDIHTVRVVAGLYSRIPPSIWLALYLLTTLSMMGIGYQAGLTSKSRSLAFPMLAVTFAVAMLLVADLDRPGEGMLRVSQQTLIDLRATMREPNSPPDKATKQESFPTVLPPGAAEIAPNANTPSTDRDRSPTAK